MTASNRSSTCAVSELSSRSSRTSISWSTGITLGSFDRDCEVPERASGLSTTPPEIPPLGELPLRVPLRPVLPVVASDP